MNVNWCRLNSTCRFVSGKYLKYNTLISHSQYVTLMSHDIKSSHTSVMTAAQSWSGKSVVEIFTTGQFTCQDMKVKPVINTSVDFIINITKLTETF